MLCFPIEAERGSVIELSSAHRKEGMCVCVSRTHSRGGVAVHKTGEGKRGDQMRLALQTAFLELLK